ncbi:hypothetical protein F1880_006723 [Penicillium rolfsii]|nr:hypothetical protein F1880_006723 [Penicillium rolfsii]
MPRTPNDLITSLILLFPADLLTLLNSLLALPTGLLPLLLQQSIELLGSIEHTTGTCPARCTRWILPITLQRTGLAKVMPTLGDDRILVGFPTDNAGKRDTVQQLVIIIVLVVFGCLAGTFSLRYNTATQFLPVGTNFPIAVQFPTLFIVLTGV